MQFRRTEFLSFGTTAATAFVVYFLTLSPEVGLDTSGFFSTVAAYGGVSMPAGFPLWTLWAGLFTKVVPFTNINRRVALASAVAAALACGMIAVMVCRMGKVMMKRRCGGLDFRRGEKRWLRGISGYAAGMVFGFNGAFWSLAVRAGPSTFNILLLCVCLWMIFRWFGRPSAKGWLSAAAFVYGALLTDSQIELALAPAIPFLMALRDGEMGRDALLTASILFLAGLVLKFAGDFTALTIGGAFFVYCLIGVPTVVAGVVLAVRTRRLFSEWRAIGLCCICLIAGMSLYLYVPIIAMTNPPVESGYPRTIGGFMHVLSRGQFESIYPTDEFAVFAKQVGGYFIVTGKQFGWPYLIAAATPILRMRRLNRNSKRCVGAILIIYGFLALLILAVVNPGPEERSACHCGMTAYRAISYVALAVLVGCGLTLLGIWLLRQSFGKTN